MWVKDLDEAFDEFPVEEEWHKGKTENVIKEGSVEYKTIYNIGDIVFVKKIKYKSGGDGFNHLFVIIDQDNIAVPIENFGMILSSNINKTTYKSNKLLKKDAVNNLNKDSAVKTYVVYKILNEQIAFKIGAVDNKRIDEYKKSFLENK